MPNSKIAQGFAEVGHLDLRPELTDTLTWDVGQMWPNPDPKLARIRAST